MQDTYSVIVRNPNSWTQDRNGGNRVHEELANCGHLHTSEKTAADCMAKLTQWYCVCGSRSDAHTRCVANGGSRHNADSTSATWYHAGVEKN